MMRPPALDSCDRYDAQPGRRYLALETDSPERWLTFAINHPKFKARVITLYFKHGGMTEYVYQDDQDARND